MKGTMSIKTLMFLAIIITVVIGGMIDVIAKLSVVYSKPTDLQSINKSISIERKMNETYELFKNQDNVESEWFGSLIVTGGKVLWNFITLMLTLPASVGDLIIDLLSQLKIPIIFVGAVGSLLLAYGIFAVIELLKS